MAKLTFNQTQQKCYFSKGNAYTEDHILVKKLFLYNVSDELKQEEVQAYFEGFGNVAKLQLFGGKQASGKKQKVTKTGFVYFFEARDAASALRHKRHNVNGRRLSVHANDSWHQPDAYAECDYQEFYEIPLILNLNDHCLEHILRELNLIDRIHFARTCTRFRGVYLLASGAVNRSLKFEEFDFLTVWDLRDFFTLSGQHLQHIHGVIPPQHCQRLCEYFGSHCINIKKMQVTASKLSVRNVKKLFAKLNRLEELQLRACSLSNASLSALKNLRLLKQLDLSDNHLLTGVNMDCLPKSIVSLRLCNCNGLQSKYLPKICRALPNLREFDLKAVYTITTGFQQLVSSKTCPVLEELTVSSGPANEYEHIAKLPALKKLILYSYEQGTTLRPDLLNWLVQYKSQQLLHFEARGQNSVNAEMLRQVGKLSALRTLMLPHNNAIGDRELECLNLINLEELNLKYWPNITNAAVLRLLFVSPKLHVLHLEECPLLTEKLLHDIIHKVRIQLRDKENRRILPIKMNIYGSKINDLSLQNANVVAKDIIDASLAPPSSSDLCLVRVTNALEFDFYSDDYDSFGSDDELEADYDRYMYDVGFLSDNDYEYDDVEMMFHDDDLLELNMDNVAELLQRFNIAIPPLNNNNPQN